MKYNFLIVMTFLISTLGCKSINSGLKSEGSSDLVLYTRGDETNVASVTDNESMLRLVNALNIEAEFIPNISGQGISKDQTRQEMFANISEAIKYLEGDDILWWYMIGHGNKGIFTEAGSRIIKYEELFDYMLKELKNRNKIIKRLNLFVLSCHSGSLIPIIKNDKYKDKLYKELIVFTPVEADQLASVREVFPELITFLNLARAESIDKASEIFKKIKYKMGSDAEEFQSALKKDEKCLSKIKYTYGSEPAIGIGDSSSDTNSSSCDIEVSDINLSNQKDPTWNDLINLTLWLFKSYSNRGNDQDPQFYTYPESLKDEPIFK